MSKERKRIKITKKCPNPLFVKWLTEWRDEAKEKDLPVHQSYNRALKSLEKYPVPFLRGKDCLILEHFGHKICAQLDKKLTEYTKTHGDIMDDVDKPAKKRKLSTPQNKQYVPAYRSGAYALLVTLNMKHNQPGYPGFVTKAELQNSAQALCDASFYKPDPGSYYTAWSSMSTLLRKALVTKSGSPARFSLTDAGMALAIQLEEAGSSNIQNCAGSSHDVGQSSQSYRATPRKNKVTHRKGSKQYSAISNTYVSEEEDDPDDPLPIASPNRSPKRFQSKTSFNYRTSHFESRKTGNKSYSAKRSPLVTRNSSPIPDTYNLSEFEDDPESFDCPPRTGKHSFSSKPPTKRSLPVPKRSSPIPDTYNLSEFEDDPESFDSPPKARKENRIGMLNKSFSPKTSSHGTLLNNEPIDLENSPEKEKYSCRPVQNGSANSSFSKKIASFSLDSSDSDDEMKNAKPLTPKPKYSNNFFGDKLKQSRAKASHDLSDTEDNYIALSENDDRNIYPSTSNPEPISDLYFGNDDDDFVMTQIYLNPPDSPKPKESISKFQEKPSQSSSQTSSSTSSKSKASPKKCSDSQSSSQTSDPHFLMPGTYDVILMVDNQEQKRQLQRPFLLELDNKGTNYEVRHLKVGDYIWVARCRSTNVEIVLPYIIERKRVDDLGQSIKDGRFQEQKVRLKQSGIVNLIYLVETHGGHHGLPETTLHQAAVNTFVIDNFQLKYTSDYKHSASYLAMLTKLISKQFKDKTIVSCDKNSLPDFDVHSDFVSLMTFADFSKGMSKTRNYTVREMFIKHLLQLYGMSIERATVITERYPTPKSLLSAYKNGGGENMLASLTYGPMKRSVGPVLSKSVYQLYTSKNFP